MNTVTSADGTTIAYERFGDGPPVVVVAGATCDRAKMRPTAEAVAEHFTVLNYDRRGRGDSGDTAPYAVQREIEDLAAVIAEAGGSAAVYGHSSGAGLALRAAANGLPITRLVLHEAPYSGDNEDDHKSAKEYGQQIKELADRGDRTGALELFLTITGSSPGDFDRWRTEPWWRQMERDALTLAYDSAVMDDLNGGPLPVELALQVAVPTLVLTGGDSYDWMLQVERRLADTLPDGRLQVLDGQSHNADPHTVAAALTDFLAARTP